MRTVFLVTRHPDVARLGPELERAGFSAPAIAPERLANDELGPTADVVVLGVVARTRLQCRLRLRPPCHVVGW